MRSRKETSASKVLSTLALKMHKEKSLHCLMTENRYTTLEEIIILPVPESPLLLDSVLTWLILTLDPLTP